MFVRLIIFIQTAVGSVGAQMKCQRVTKVNQILVVIWIGYLHIWWFYFLSVLQILCNSPVLGSTNLSGLQFDCIYVHFVSEHQRLQLCKVWKCSLFHALLTRRRQCYALFMTSLKGHAAEIPEPCFLAVANRENVFQLQTMVTQTKKNSCSGITSYPLHAGW